MNPQELRELDAWIAENVFDLNSTVGLMKRGYFYRPGAAGYCYHAADAGKYTLEEAKKHECIRGEEDDVKIVQWEVPQYSAVPAFAMEVLKKCIEKLGWGRVTSFGQTSDGNYFVNHTDCEPNSESFCNVEAETLELAICLFAKQLFAKA